MRPRPSLPATALAAAAALLLTACGGGNETSKDSGKIEGAHQDDKSSAESSPPSSAKRPQIKIPNGFEMTFERWESTDPKENAVLQDGRERVRAVNEAILQNPANPESPHVSFYNAEGALDSGKRWIDGFKKNGLTITGEVRYLDPQVGFRDDGSATLVYCADESKGFSKNVKTGKVDDESSSSPYVRYTTLLKKNGEGVWQTVRVVNERGACKG
ncbi:MULTISPECIES: hypothetical protein [Streptomyces]|uniref:Lipoprotein n=1 Tax=Streptomyces lycii TaxID=2654337 RepID=A0ABQ7FAU5_9ACTN|nr:MULTISPECIES: hypothetical protein [Streptomyces]KAF4405365.1 hypothetical protein GCU69_30335 [Streptomyces lycii]